MRTKAINTIVALLASAGVFCTVDNLAGGGVETGNGGVVVSSAQCSIFVSGPSGLLVYVAPHKAQPLISPHLVDSGSIGAEGQVAFQCSEPDSYNVLVFNTVGSAVLVPSIPVCSSCSLRKEVRLSETSDVRGVLLNADYTFLDSAVVQVQGSPFVAAVEPGGEFSFSGIPTGQFSVPAEKLTSQPGFEILTCTMNPEVQSTAVQSRQLSSGATVMLDTIFVDTVTIDGRRMPVYMQPGEGGEEDKATAYVLDSLGNRIDLRALKDSLRAVRYELYGVIDPALFHQLDSLNDDDTVEVWIVVKDTASCPPKSTKEECPRDPTYEEFIAYLESTFGRTIVHEAVGSDGGRMFLKKKEILQLKYSALVSGGIVSASRLDSTYPVITH